MLRRVGAMVEGEVFYPYLSGRKNLEVLARISDHYDPARIMALLEQRVRLAGRAGHVSSILNRPEFMRLFNFTPTYHLLWLFGLMAVTVFLFRRHDITA